MKTTAKYWKCILLCLLVGLVTSLWAIPEIKKAVDKNLEGVDLRGPEAIRYYKEYIQQIKANNMTVPEFIEN